MLTKQVHWLYGGKRRIKVGPELRAVFDLEARGRARDVRSVHVRFPDFGEGMEAVVAVGDPAHPQEALLGPVHIRHPQMYWMWFGSIDVPAGNAIRVVVKCTHETCCTVEMGGD